MSSSCAWCASCRSCSRLRFYLRSRLARLDGWVRPGDDIAIAIHPAIVIQCPLGSVNRRLLAVRSDLLAVRDALIEIGRRLLFVEFAL